MSVGAVFGALGLNVMQNNWSNLFSELEKDDWKIILDVLDPKDMCGDTLGNNERPGLKDELKEKAAIDAIILVEG